AGRARQAVERLVVEGDFRRPEQFGPHCAAARAPVAADLEEVGEVGGEIEREVQLLPALRVARDGEELVAARIPQKLGARDMERVLGEDEMPALIEKVGIS